MNAKIQILAASAIACLTSGCVIPAPYYSEPVTYGRPVAVVPEEEIILPSVIIVEHGVRHDRAFYRRYPEYYRRDRMRHPELFRPEYPHGHAPVYHESYHAPVVVAPVYHGSVPPPHVVVVHPEEPGEHHPNDPKAKKKKHDDKDKDHDDHDH